MKTMIKTPKMLSEVWKMKERVYKKIKHMNYKELFKYLEQQTQKEKNNKKKGAQDQT